MIFSQNLRRETNFIDKYIEYRTSEQTKNVHIHKQKHSRVQPHRHNKITTHQKSRMVRITGATQISL